MVVYTVVTIGGFILLLQGSFLGDVLIFLAAMMGFLYYAGSRRGWFD